MIKSKKSYWFFIVLWIFIIVFNIIVSIYSGRVFMNGHQLVFRLDGWEISSLVLYIVAILWIGLFSGFIWDRNNLGRPLNIKDIKHGRWCVRYLRKGIYEMWVSGRYTATRRIFEDETGEFERPDDPDETIEIRI